METRRNRRTQDSCHLLYGNQFSKKKKKKKKNYKKKPEKRKKRRSSAELKNMGFL